MNLITLTDPQSPKSEAYRTLRTNLSFYSLDKPIRNLVVTSPAVEDEECKSEAIANLAVTMAQGGKRTILVDCDLRRPSLAPLFGLESDPGLTSIILSESGKLPLQKTEVENLWLLASGPKPPNPADLLGSQQFDKIIEAMNKHADIILFAAPPITAVADAIILGAKVDGVLMVLNAGKTRRDHTQKAKERLETAHVTLIGAALINAPKDSATGDYYG